MLELQAAGLGEIVAAPDPLAPAGEEAISAWNFCGGYEPDRLRLYAELHGLTDVDMTIFLMGVIRDSIDGR